MRIVTWLLLRRIVRVQRDFNGIEQRQDQKESQLVVGALRFELGISCAQASRRAFSTFLLKLNEL
jgi:hypothetical protein